MEYLVSEYEGPLTVCLPGVDVPGQAALSAWSGAPSAVDERGEVVIDLDPPATPYWAGTVTVVPPPGAPPVPLPPDGELVLRMPDGCQAGAEVESVTWTVDEALVLAVVGRGDAPF